jgi:hypothetical protein
VRSGLVGWAAGVGQADLAARGQSPVGLAGLLCEEAAAFGGCQELVVDLAVVEGAGGDQVVEVAGRLPQLAVAVPNRGGGDPSELLGQCRPRIPVSRAVTNSRELGRDGRPLQLAGLEPLQQHPRDLGRGASRSRPGTHW